MRQSILQKCDKESFLKSNCLFSFTIKIKKNSQPSPLIPTAKRKENLYFLPTGEKMKRINPRKSLTLFALFFAALCFFACTSTTEPEKTESSSSGLDRFEQSSNIEITTKADSEFVYNYQALYFLYYNQDSELENPLYYLSDVSKSSYAQKEFAATRYMYSEMSDLFTHYYTPAYYDYIMSQLTESESVTDIGMLVDSTLKVKLVYPNGSAKTAGVQKGDSIISVNNTVISSYDSYQNLVDLSTATTFSIGFLRGDSSFTATLYKTSLLLPTVYLDSLEGIPVITITEFTDSTSNPKGTMEEFRDILEETSGASSTVLDLRGNPGGSIDHCVGMAEMLLSKGDTAIIMESTDADTINMVQKKVTEAEIASENGIGSGRYYVVLLDTGSASCAEMFSAAITSNLEAPVVGMTSYGKGIGQYYIETYAQGIAGITSLHIFDKDGKSYHTYGILPDFEIADPASAMEKAVELAKEGTYRRTAGYGTTVLDNWTGTKWQMKQSSKSSLIPSVPHHSMYRILKTKPSSSFLK